MSENQLHKQALERLVTLQVQRLFTDIALCARYEGTESKYDISIITENGVLAGVGEITQDCNDFSEAFLSSMAQAGNQFPLPSGFGAWVVSLARFRPVKTLAEEITPVIRAARLLGKDELSPERDWLPLPIHGAMERVGLLDLVRIEAKGDRCFFFGPFHGGLIDGRPELLIEYIEETLLRPPVMKRLAKLESSDCAMREIVLISARPEDHPSMTYRMNGWSQWPGTPSSAPDIPDYLTGVWIVQPALGHVVAWRKNSGWLYGPPQGVDWWREFEGDAHLQYLFVETEE